MQYILLTGASGFIGSHLLGKLLLDGSYRPICIVRKSSCCERIEELRSAGVLLVEGSFCDRVLVSRVFNEYPIRHVIHLAGLRGAGAGSRRDYAAVNVGGTEALLEAAHQRGVQKFIFCSSVGVFGTIPKTLPANPRTELCADNLYHWSKIAAERKVLEYAGRGLGVCVLRPTITYGAGDNGFSATLVELLRKRRLLLPRADIKIHLLDVDRLSELVLKILEAEKADKQVFIVADESAVSLLELANLVHSHYHGRGYPPYLRIPNFVLRLLAAAFRVLADEKWITRMLLISESWYYDISETVSTFGYRPATTQQAFLRSMCP